MKIPKTEITEYIHREAGEEVDSPAWRYRSMGEIRLPVSRGEVLCVLAFSKTGSACCGAGEVRYFMVPGRILTWKNGCTAEGRPTSRVEAVIDGCEMDEIRFALGARFPGCQVCF
ncbi:MAG TPA: hypothetical protein VLM75_03135 [Spirochaetota bacterium]|nr:hypothetical protein [Spirochaetota bacterium]